MSSKQDKVKEINKEISYILSVGFYGGLFASTLAYFAYLLNFVPFGPGIILQLVPVYTTAWLAGMLGQIFSIILISFFSIAASFLYYLLFRLLDSPWVGVCYGLAWWGIIFLGLNQLIPGVQGIGKLGLTTNIVFLSIFVLYGLFVGYSISFEHNVEQLHGDT